MAEAAREIIANSNSFSFDDLHLVAKEHATKIEQAISGDIPLVIVDTDVHTTKSYSKFVFGKEFEVSKELYSLNKGHLYLYLNNDVEYFQDGTRLSRAKRDLLDLSHRQVLEDHNIHVVEIKGNWQERFEKAVEHVDKLLAIKQQKQNC